MKYNKYCSCLALGLCFLSLSSCSKKGDKELNKLLVELADADMTIDREDWERLEDYLDANQAHFKAWYADGQLNVDLVKQHIRDLFERRHAEKPIKFVGIGGAEHLKVNFYLERSGSMTPYDAKTGDGSFKRAIVQLLNSLPNANDENSMYVVNSSIEPYPQGFSNFVRDTNIFESTKGIGDPSFTDFGAIFHQLINQTKDNELSILVTDMIYSTKSMVGVNPQKVFAEAHGMISSVFKAAVKDKSMLIVKMRGSYDGPYYSYNSPSSGKRYSGYRPYYIIMVGDNDNIARLSADTEYSAFAKLAELPGFENQYLFTTEEVYEPYYTILLHSKESRGRFKPERGQTRRITDIEDVELDANSGDFQLAVAVNLKGMFVDEGYLLNPQNYDVEANDNFVIKAIKPLDKSDLTQSEKKYASSATHVLVLSTNNLTTAQEVSVKLKNQLPQWVANSSSDDDTNLAASSFSSTTFGLRYLLEGIYSSYQKEAEGKPYYFELELNIKK